MTSLSDYRKEVDYLRGKQKTLREEIRKFKYDIRGLNKQIKTTSEAKTVLAVVSSETQKRFIGYIENLVTLALQSVYGEGIKFIVEYKQKEDSWECVMMVQEDDGEPYFPKSETGGGVVDIVSLSLRVVNWSIKTPETRPIMILDEPMGAIGKGDLSERAISMLREISDRLGIQFIIVTHSYEIANLADRAWNIVKRKRVSKVEQIVGVEEKRGKLNRR